LVWWGCKWQRSIVVGGHHEKPVKDGRRRRENNLKSRRTKTCPASLCRHTKYHIPKPWHSDSCKTETITQRKKKWRVLAKFYGYSHDASTFGSQFDQLEMLANKTKNISMKSIIGT